MFYLFEDQTTAELDLTTEAHRADAILVASNVDRMALQHVMNRMGQYKHALAAAARFLRLYPGNEEMAATLDDLRFVQADFLSGAEREAIAKSAARAVYEAHSDAYERTRGRLEFQHINRWALEWVAANPKSGNKGPVARVVQNVETGQTWPSVKALASALGAVPQTVYSHLRGDPSYKTVRGQTYRYVD